MLDDLHWADEASLRLLRFVAGALGGARLLVLATYRDVEVRRGHPLADLLPVLARESTCERIVLRGLELDDTAAFIHRITGSAPAHGLAVAVHEMTEGNPFFIQEIARLLQARAARPPRRIASRSSSRRACARRSAGD